MERVVLALGNPGARYARTRHNIGWMATDALAGRLGAAFGPGPGEYYQAKVRVEGVTALLVKPTTYMNNSGIAARQLAERHGITPADILAVVDEIQFPVGRIQLKSSGSSGGHNGLESIIYHLESMEFPRLRCGVGKDFGPGEMAEYVLSPFPESQRELVERMIDEAADAVHTWILHGTARSMNLVNTRGSAGSEPSAGGNAPAGGTTPAPEEPARGTQGTPERG